MKSFDSGINIDLENYQQRKAIFYNKNLKSSISINEGYRRGLCNAVIIAIKRIDFKVNIHLSYVIMFVIFWVIFNGLVITNCLSFSLIFTSQFFDDTISAAMDKYVTNGYMQLLVIGNFRFRPKFRFRYEFRFSSSFRFRFKIQPKDEPKFRYFRYRLKFRFRLIKTTTNHMRGALNKMKKKSFNSIFVLWGK